MNVTRRRTWPMLRRVLAVARHAASAPRQHRLLQARWLSTADGVPRRRQDGHRTAAAPARRLHPDTAQRRALVGAAMDLLDRLESHAPPIAGSGFEWMLPTATGSAAEARAEQQRVAAQVAGLDLAVRDAPDAADAVFADLEAGVRVSTDDNAPGYMAYIPSGGLFHSAVGSMVGAAVNRYVTIASAAPALAAIEEAVLQWLCTAVVGFTRSSGADQLGGILTSGGAFANTLALHAARHRAHPSNAGLDKATVYVSEQAHYCVAKGAAFIGVLPQHVRIVPSHARDDGDLSMNVDALRTLVASDIASGLTPLVIAATAGTTNSGAVDDLLRIRDVCAEFDGVWFHVDAAYGGAFGLTPHARRHVLHGLASADSVVVDPHKGLFAPYGLGALLVRDRRVLQSANQSDGACMPPAAVARARPAAEISEMIAGLQYQTAAAGVEASTAPFDSMNMGLELSRDFRGLALWLPLKLLGADAFRAQLADKLELAQYAAAALVAQRVPNLVVVSPPTLSCFTFKLEASAAWGGSVADGDNAQSAAHQVDALNADLFRAIAKRGRTLLSPFRSVSGRPGELVIRMAVLSHHTDLAAVDKAIEDIVSSAREVQQLDAAAGEAPRQGRAKFLVPSAEDVVADYRQLAALPLWQDMVSSVPKRGDGSLPVLRVLDVCCGSGRWLQAFSDVVLDGRRETPPADAAASGDAIEVSSGTRRVDANVVGVDLCEESLALLRIRMGRMPCVHAPASGPVTVRGNAAQLQATLAAAGCAPSYDVVTCAHGLYGVPKAVLHDVIRGMVAALAGPSGEDDTTVRAAVIAQGAEDGVYCQAGALLHAHGIFDAPYVSAEDVVAAASDVVADSLGTLHMEVHSHRYEEMIAHDDSEALHRFLLDESGGNTFTAADTRVAELDAEQQTMMSAFRPLMAAHTAAGQPRVYKFKQHTQVVIITKRA